MIIALGLLAAVAVIGIGAPRYLSVTVAPGLHPRLALAAWTASVTLMLAAIVAAPVSMITRPGRTTFGAAHACLHRLRTEGSLPWIDTAQVILTAALGAMTLYLAATVARHLLRRRRATRRHLHDLRAITTAQGDHRGTRVLWIDTPEPVCYSIGGRSPAVVASRHIADLPAPERAAVLDHELAHLRGRHHALVSISESLAAAAPFIPLLRQAPDAARTLVEFAADHRSADRHGPAVVGGALMTVHAESGTASARTAAPAMALALSQEAVAARLCWLATDPSPRQKLCGRAGYPLAMATALTPVVLSVATILTAAALICLHMSA